MFVWLVGLWIAEVALLVLDIVTGREISFRHYFLLPALVAAVFAPPRQVVLLCMAAIGSLVISGWLFGHLFTVPYFVRLGAFFLISITVVLLAANRECVAARIATDRARVRAMLDSLLDPHVLLRPVRGPEGAITDFVFADANAAACRYNRTDRRDLLGRRLLELLPAHRGTGLFDHYRRAVESGKPLALDDFCFANGSPGVPRFFDIRGVKVGDELSLTWRDVTDRHDATSRLQDRARTDGLTHLLNRSEVLERLEQLRNAAPRTGKMLAVLFIDFDNFKGINDTFGHAAGDEILRVTAERLRACLRHDDIGARIGGDEMMVVLSGVRDLADATAIADKLRQHASEPVRINGKDITATVSIGVALALPDETSGALVARADKAMFEAKRNGHNRVIAVAAG